MKKTDKQKRRLYFSFFCKWTRSNNFWGLGVAQTRRPLSEEEEEEEEEKHLQICTELLPPVTLVPSSPDSFHSSVEIV